MRSFHEPPFVAATLASAADSRPAKWRRPGPDARSDRNGSTLPIHGVDASAPNPPLNVTFDSGNRSLEWNCGFRQKAATCVWTFAAARGAWAHRTLGEWPKTVLTRPPIEGVPPLRRAALKRGLAPACIILLLIVALGPGCSIKRFTVNQIGDALAAGGATFASDDDPELIRAAAPFSLKLMESLLAESPRHDGLLFATASGFTQYAYAFVQQDADELEGTDFAAARAHKTRARNLYLRARDYGLRGLEVHYRGIGSSLRRQPAEAVRGVRARDVPLLYWTAVSWAAAISLSKDDPGLIAEQPQVESLIDRALELDEAYDSGAIHSFLISYEPSRQGASGPAEARARRHFERAVELSGGRHAGPFVALAESVAVQKQDVTEFRTLLERALGIDPGARPEWRLVNLVLQRRARWLLSRTDELFLLSQ